MAAYERLVPLPERLAYCRHALDRIGKCAQLTCWQDEPQHGTRNPYDGLRGDDYRPCRALCIIRKVSDQRGRVFVQELPDGFDNVFTDLDRRGQDYDQVAEPKAAGRMRMTPMIPTTTIPATAIPTSKRFIQWPPSEFSRRLLRQDAMALELRVHICLCWQMKEDTRTTRSDDPGMKKPLRGQVANRQHASFPHGPLGGATHPVTTPMKAWERPREGLRVWRLSE